jgi:hypothetical protein
LRDFDAVVALELAGKVVVVQDIASNHQGGDALGDDAERHVGERPDGGIEACLVRRLFRLRVALLGPGKDFVEQCVDLFDATRPRVASTSAPRSRQHGAGARVRRSRPSSSSEPDSLRLALPSAGGHHNV